MLMESYEQSKRTPAYRELRTKYKALKKSHKEIVLALSALAQGISFTNEEPNADVPRNKRKSKSHLDSRTTEIVDEIIDLSIEDDLSPQEPVVIKVEPGALTENIQIVNYTEREAEIAAGVDLDEEEEIVEIVEEETEPEEIVEVVEEEEEETEEIVEVVEEEEEETEETEEIVEVVEEEEETGVYEIEINGKRYYTTNEQDGIVYEIDGEDDVGDEIGKFVNGKFKLNA